MTLHESIIKKINAGWSDSRIRQEYHWIQQQNLTAVINGAKSAVRRMK